MKPDDFPKIKVLSVGIYRLVPEETLELLLKKAALDRAGSPSNIGELIFIHRQQRRMTLESLASEAKLERKALWLLEQNKTKRPHQETLRRLVSVFGDSFQMALQDLGLTIKKALSNDRNTSN